VSIDSEDEIQVVAFRTGPQEFALDILQVERILRWEQPTPLPKAPAFLEGVIPYEGDAVPVVDLRKRLELPAELRPAVLLVVLVFLATLAAGYVYAWRKGVFQWR